MAVTGRQITESQATIVWQSSYYFVAFSCVQVLIHGKNDRKYELQMCVGFPVTWSILLIVVYIFETSQLEALFTFNGMC